MLVLSAKGAEGGQGTKGAKQAKGIDFSVPRGAKRQRDLGCQAGQRKPMKNKKLTPSVKGGRLGQEDNRSGLKVGVLRCGDWGKIGNSC